MHALRLRWIVVVDAHQPSLAPFEIDILATFEGVLDGMNAVARRRDRHPTAVARNVRRTSFNDLSAFMIVQVRSFLLGARIPFYSVAT